VYAAGFSQPDGGVSFVLGDAASFWLLALLIAAEKPKRQSLLAHLALPG